MYSVDRTRCIAGALVALASALTGAALALREPARCECAPVRESAVHVLPEVEVVAKRLPPGGAAPP